MAASSRPKPSKIAVLIYALTLEIPLNIKSLKYGPTLVNHNLSIMDCPKLKNLRYCPKKVMENIVIGDTGKITIFREEF